MYAVACMPRSVAVAGGAGEARGARRTAPCGAACSARRGRRRAGRGRLAQRRQGRRGVRARPQLAGGAQIGRGVHVAPYARHRARGQFDGARRGVPGAGGAAEPRRERGARRRRQQRRTDPCGVREEGARVGGGRREDAFQLGGAQRGQVGVERGECRAGPRRAHRAGAVRQGRVQPRRRGVLRHPRPERRQRRAGPGVVRDDHHIPDRRTGQRGGHRVLGERQREPGPRRAVERRGEPALGQDKGFERDDQAPGGRRARVGFSAHPGHSRPLPGPPRRRCLAAPREGGRTVFSTERGPGATLVRPPPGRRSHPRVREEEGARVSRRRIGFWYRLAAVIAKPPLVLLFKRDWSGMENIPADGGFITAVNHNSYLDPLSYAHYQYNTGRVPRFLAKNGLFGKGFVGAVMRGTGQIPVYRETTNALDAFRAALDAIERGECVAFYPEGTLTRDPAMWPMTAKTGAARVALRTRCPVIPVAQWGANLAMPPYAKENKLQLLPRKTLQVKAGPPVDLSAYYDLEPTPEVLREVTETIMAAVTALLAEMRGEPAPATPYDPRTARLKQRRTGVRPQPPAPAVCESAPGQKSGENNQ
ncbi:1-acyl-sn-glycerol-3-phosphate acyltransferase [Streptomyces sp. FR-008]|nr:1-acyl-sn-glycerol-3-phosphate acyltransferase [Streptomyces sp. FR-008]